MEEKVILRKHVRLISPFSLALSLQSFTFACPVKFRRRSIAYFNGELSPLSFYL